MIGLSTTPYEEKCAQVGAPMFREHAEIETRAMLDQLREQFGEPPTGVRLVVKWQMHDFGSYPTIDVEVDVEYGTEEQRAWIRRVDEEWPARWTPKMKRRVNREKRELKERWEAFREHEKQAVMSGGFVDNPADWGL